MLDTHVTVVGNLVADPRLIETAGRPAMASFRLASTPRRYDRASGEWRDGETLFTNVTCWRGLAENVALSLKKGQAVIVHGRLMKRSYETKTGEHRESVDIDAMAVGPELTRVAAVVKRIERSSSSPSSEWASGDTADAADAAEAADTRLASEEFDAAIPVLDDPDADGDAADLGDGDLENAEQDGDLEGADAELAEEPELVGASGGGRRRSRFGIG